MSAAAAPATVAAAIKTFRSDIDTQPQLSARHDDRRTIGSGCEGEDVASCENWLLIRSFTSRVKSSHI